MAKGQAKSGENSDRIIHLGLDIGTSKVRGITDAELTNANAPEVTIDKDRKKISLRYDSEKREGQEVYVAQMPNYFAQDSTDEFYGEAAFNKTRGRNIELDSDGFEGGSVYDGGRIRKVDYLGKVINHFFKILPEGKVYLAVSMSLEEYFNLKESIESGLEPSEHVKGLRQILYANPRIEGLVSVPQNSAAAMVYKNIAFPDRESYKASQAFALVDYGRGNLTVAAANLLGENFELKKEHARIIKEGEENLGCQWRDKMFEIEVEKLGVKISPKDAKDVMDKYSFVGKNGPEGLKSFSFGGFKRYNLYDIVREISSRSLKHISRELASLVSEAPGQCVIEDSGQRREVGGLVVVNGEGANTLGFIPELNDTLKEDFKNNDIRVVPMEDCTNSVAIGCYNLAKAKTRNNSWPKRPEYAASA